MTELNVLAFSGMAILAAATAALVTVFHHRERVPVSRPQPYVGEFVPEETAAQRRDREKLSAWRAMLHEANQ